MFDGMEKSPEIEAVVRRIFDSVVRGDYETFRNLASRSDNVISVDVTTYSWWRGHETATHSWEVRREEVDLVRVEFDRVEAFQSGNFGWAVAVVDLFSAAGDRFSQRFTGVFELQAGAWRWVHTHSSHAVPGVDFWGIEVTNTLEGLVGSLDEASTEELDRVSTMGTVTIVFTDVEGSTTLSREVGDAEWAETLETHFATVTQTVEQYGGTVIKTLGDGAMAAFPAADLAVEAAIRLQQRIQESGLPVRIGVHTGDAQKVGGDYVGLAVSEAARVASAARGGEVLLSSTTAALTAGSGRRLEGPRSVTLKGLPGAHSLTPVNWRSH